MSANEAGHDSTSENGTAGNVRGEISLNLAIKTIQPVRNTTREAFILHALDVQWTCTTLQIGGREKQTYHIILWEAFLRQH